MSKFKNKIEKSDYVNFTKSIPNESRSFACFDPPYSKGNNKGDVLKGHKIQSNVNIPYLVSEVWRVLKKDSFFAIFGQMPSISAWHYEIMNRNLPLVRRKRRSPF